MPFYEYCCQACGEELEVLQKISEPLLVDCPACEKPALKKKISAAAFRLKGGGWYETDFKNKNKRNVAESGEKSESKDKDAKDSSGQSGDKAKSSGTEKNEKKDTQKASSAGSSS